MLAPAAQNSWRRWLRGARGVTGGASDSWRLCASRLRGQEFRGATPAAITPHRVRSARNEQAKGSRPVSGSITPEFHPAPAAGSCPVSIQGERVCEHARSAAIAPADLSASHLHGTPAPGAWRVLHPLRDGRPHAGSLGADLGEGIGHASKRATTKLRHYQTVAPGREALEIDSEVCHSVAAAVAASARTLLLGKVGSWSAQVSTRQRCKPSLGSPRSDAIEACGRSHRRAQQPRLRSTNSSSGS